MLPSMLTAAYGHMRASVTPRVERRAVSLPSTNVAGTQVRQPDAAGQLDEVLGHDPAVRPDACCLRIQVSSQSFKHCSPVVIGGCEPTTPGLRRHRASRTRSRLHRQNSSLI
jgi:hypothetical protein